MRTEGGSVYNNIYNIVGWLFRGFKSELEGSFSENKVPGCGRLVRGEILLPEVGEFIPGNFLTLYNIQRDDSMGLASSRWSEFALTTPNFLNASLASASAMPWYLHTLQNSFSSIDLSPEQNRNDASFQACEKIISFVLYIQVGVAAHLDLKQLFEYILSIESLVGNYRWLLNIKERKKKIEQKINGKNACTKI